MHQPEQRLTDYKAQKATREAPIIALLSTVMMGVLSSVVASTLAVRGFIGQYVPNFFPDYVPWHLVTMPLYTPWALGCISSCDRERGDLRHNVHTWRTSWKRVYCTKL